VHACNTHAPSNRSRCVQLRTGITNKVDVQDLLHHLQCLTGSSSSACPGPSHLSTAVFDALLDGRNRLDDPLCSTCGTFLGDE
jgi:hypothetical protein